MNFTEEQQEIVDGIQPEVDKNTHIQYYLDNKKKMGWRSGFDMLHDHLRIPRIR